MKKTRFDLEQELLECWGVVNDVNDVFQYVGDDEFFTGMDPKHYDKIMNLLLGISELYDVKFQKLWNTFEQNLKNESFHHRPEMLELGGVTRVEVIGDAGRDYVNTGASQVHISFQDDDQTLKLFVRGVGDE